MNTLKLSSLTQLSSQSQGQVATRPSTQLAKRLFAAAKAEIADFSSAFKFMLIHLY